MNYPRIYLFGDTNIAAFPRGGSGDECIEVDASTEVE